MSQNQTEETNTNQVCSNSFRKHWAEAQIDGPMHEVIRYDDVAKLLITIGGFVLVPRAGVEPARLFGQRI